VKSNNTQFQPLPLRHRWAGAVLVVVLLWGLLPLNVWMDAAQVKQRQTLAEETTLNLNDADDTPECGLEDSPNGASEAALAKQELRAAVALGQYVGLALGSHTFERTSGRELCVRLCRWLL